MCDKYNNIVIIINDNKYLDNNESTEIWSQQTFFLMKTVI